jgi:amidase
LHDVLEEQPLITPDHHSHMPLAGAIAAAVNAGETNATAVVQRHLEVIREHEPAVHAWQHLDAEGAIFQAAELDRARTPGQVLAGVPVGLKDNIDTFDMPTGYGTELYEDHCPGRDAACAASLRLAGAVIMGKTVSTEFAHRAPGATRNPWRPRHTPGGSSSGSAAAVACGMVPLALGTQTTGSVIRPAAYCGVIGYKATYGELNIAGVLPNSPSFDTLGVMARSVADVGLVRQALLDVTVPAVEAAALQGSRVGLCRTPWWGEATEDNRAFIESAATTLLDAGCRVSDFDGGDVFEGLDEFNLTISGYEFARTLAHERRTAMGRLSPLLRDGRMADGLRGDYDGFVQALRGVERARLTLDAALEELDFLITPAAPGAALAGLDATGPATFNMPWTTLHTPALTLPVGRSTDGLPLGLQLVARRHADDRLLALAQAVLGLFDER